MPKPNLEELFSLPDPQLQDNFSMDFINLPAAIGGSTANERLRLQCQDSNLPDKSIEAVPVELFGQQLQFGGRNINAHTLSVTYVETNDMIIYNTLNSWLEVIRNFQTQHGASKVDYAAKALLTTYKETGEESGVYTLENIWVQNLPNLAVAGNTSAIITVGVTFQFDVWYPGNGIRPTV